MFRLTLAAVLGLALTSPVLADFKRIATEDDFRALVVGKRLNFEDNHFTIRKNGKLTGRFGGKSLRGAWAWRDGYWCRTLTTHAQNTDCQQWEADGTQFRVTRERGKGASFVYTRN